MNLDYGEHKRTVVAQLSHPEWTMANQRAIEAERPRARGGAPSWLGLVGWILFAAAAGAVGGIASRNADTFYASLVKPAWAPPGWLFGPVWSTL